MMYLRESQIKDTKGCELFIPRIKQNITALSPLRNRRDYTGMPFTFPKFKYLKNNNPGRNNQRIELEKRMAPLSIFSDASCDNGNGNSTCSALLKIDGEAKTHRSLSLGEMDNNVAEFYGIYTGISLLSSIGTNESFMDTDYRDKILKARHVCFYTDSKFILSKVHAVLRNRIDVHAPEGIELANKLIKGFQLLQDHLDLESHIVWIPRYLNPHADSLSKQRF